MKRILGYYIMPPGELWVRFEDGEMRPVADGMPKVAADGMPEVAADGRAVAPAKTVPGLDWQDPRCQQPQTGSVQRYAA